MFISLSPLSQVVIIINIIVLYYIQYTLYYNMYYISCLQYTTKVQLLYVLLVTNRPNFILYSRCLQRLFDFIILSQKSYFEFKGKGKQRLLFGVNIVDQNSSGSPQNGGQGLYWRFVSNYSVVMCGWSAGPRPLYTRKSRSTGNTCV